MINGDGLEGLAWLGVVLGGFVAGGNLGNTVGLTLWEYNMYDAYRDAGAKDTTKYNVLQNYAATFNPFNIVDPVGAPFLGVTAITMVANHKKGTVETSNAYMAPVFYGFVGLGDFGCH